MLFESGVEIICLSKLVITFKLNTNEIEANHIFPSMVDAMIHAVFCIRKQSNLSDDRWKVF